MLNLHTFTDDALAFDDATGVAERIRRREISACDALEAALARAAKVEPVLNAIQTPDFARARHIARSGGYQSGVFAGVPSIIKDNNDVQGLPTLHGSAAVKPKPAKKNGVLVEQLLNQGFVNIGKSTLPEFGFSASTEPAHAEPTRNPWNTDYSSGASSGGAAALVAAGVLPIAHANDGGGSIRIPAACCGLVGLKCSRGRLVASEQARTLPVNVIADGVVTRSVRDTAHFFAQAERYYRNPDLPEIGEVSAPGQRRLRIAYFIDSVTGAQTDEETRNTLADNLKLLEQLGHQVEEITPPVTAQFADDFVAYWGLFAFSMHRMGKLLVAPSFDNKKVDGLTRGLSRHYQKQLHKTPAILKRLKQTYHDYAQLFTQHDIILSPVLAHTTPKLGYLHPEQDFAKLVERLRQYASFTPYNNTAGGPAISLPLGHSASNTPIGLHFSANHGDERTLLELAFELEAAQPFRQIYATA